MKANPLHRSPVALLTAIASLGLMCMPLVAQAQGSAPCLAFPAVVEALGDKYSEQPTGAGLVNEGAAVVLFTAPAGDTWTLVVRKADGETCFLASGSNWTARAPAPAGKEG